MFQKPDASAIAGYDAWKKKFHRHVKEGEKGNIIENNANVFFDDIDETETAQYNVDVQTVTAGVLNAMTRDELTAYLATVDFIYLNAGNATYKYRYNNSAYDLDNDAVELIFEKVCKIFFSSESYR